MFNLLRYGIRRSLHSSRRDEKIIIALGSNIGNRAKTIQDAVDKLGNFAQVSQTSFLYESTPMYVTDQPAFLNAVCEIETNLDPLDLLHTVKDIEKDLGRDLRGVRNGPRPIDLDIITYGERILTTPNNDLIIPHPRLAEREFVLRPICDISPDIPIPQHTADSIPASTLLDKLIASNGSGQLIKVTPTHTGHLLRWGQRTLLMGIINATPDSFSDGGKHNTIDTALAQAEKFANYGFDIIDIGGQSTRPGAQLLPPETELSRVLPLTSALHYNFPNLLISADTFHATVAQEMMSSGAQLINDVSGGMHDADMHQTLASNRAASILMHMRGTPETMQKMTDYHGSLLNTIAAELKERLVCAQHAGIRKWSLVADAGIGFAKTAEQSALLAGNCADVQRAIGGFPIVLGVSRKSFLKSVTKGVDRDWTTAGAVAAAVSRGGVDVVRVHKAEIGDVVRGAEQVCGLGGV